jgi:hypothetical protein
MSGHASLPVNTRLPEDREANIRNEIRMSARRMVTGLEVAKKEQANLAKHFAALEKHGTWGASSRLARDTGISKQLVCMVLSGQKKVGAVAARRIAKAGI